MLFRSVAHFALECGKKGPQLLGNIVHKEGTLVKDDDIVGVSSPCQCKAHCQNIDKARFWTWKGFRCVCLSSLLEDQQTCAEGDDWWGGNIGPRVTMLDKTVGPDKTFELCLDGRDFPSAKGGPNKHEARRQLFFQ